MSKSMNVTFNGDIIVLNEHIYIVFDVEFHNFSNEMYPVWKIFIDDKFFKSLESLDYTLQEVIEMALFHGEKDVKD